MEIDIAVLCMTDLYYVRDVYHIYSLQFKIRTLICKFIKLILTSSSTLSDHVHIKQCRY